MNPERLLQNFDRLVDTPDAVPRLRRFILDLAVRGKLVEQNPEDEPAAELLKRIEVEKTRLVKEGKIRKDKPLSLTEEETMPFGLPKLWEWVPIRKITADRGQKIPDKKFSYIDVSAIDKERGKIGEPLVLTPDAAPSRARKIVQQGDVIYSCVRPYLLNIAVVDKDFKPEPIVSTAFAVLNGLGFVLPQYLWILLRSPYFVRCVEEKMRGQAYPAINDSDFAPLPVPLPPLAEQHRIVAKVDELMSLCDELEAAQTKRERRRDRLVAATLHGLNNGETDLEEKEKFPFEESARFYFSHLPRLTTRPEHIQQLRQTIMRLGVSGKLHGINNTELRVFSVGDLCQPIDGDRGSNYPKKHDYKSVGYCLFLSTKNVRPDGFDFTECVFIDKEKHEQLRSGTLERGDVIVTTRGTIGNVAVYDNSVRFTVVRINSGMLILRPDKSVIYKKFLSLFIRSPLFTEQTAALRTGTAQPQLPAKTLRMFTVIVPSLEDQYRIVAKVSNLIALCDELEDRITTISTTRFQLLEATIHEALNGSVQLHSNVS